MSVPAAMRHSEIDADTNKITGDIIDAAIKVHRFLGPGLYGKTYRVCLRHELERRGHRVDMALDVPLVYEGLSIPDAYDLDLLVDGRTLVELKAKEQLHKSDFAQVSTYLKRMDLRVGLLMNFHATPLKDGIHRIVR